MDYKKSISEYWQYDVSIAKHYLNEEELRKLNKMDMNWKKYKYEQVIFNEKSRTISGWKIFRYK